MRDSKKIFLAIFGLALMSCMILLSTRGARAHSEEPHQSSITARVSSDPPTTAYVYIAKPGDNLTLLVRRSLQLYAESKNTLLSKAALIYAETNTVKKLGSKQLDIGERVSIPFDVIQMYIVRSRDLSAADRAAWQHYVTKADFTLKDVTPANLKAAQKANQPQTSSTSVEKPTQTKKVKQTFPFKRVATVLSLSIICLVWVMSARNSQSQGKNAKVKR